MTTTSAKRVHAPDATTAPGGALIGLAAGLALILVQFALRAVAGAAPPPEAVPDRFAPNLGIALFFRLLDLFGGYSPLKEFGVGSIVFGELLVAVAVGAIYARMAQSGRKRARIFVGSVALAAWILSVALLWPVLPANYRGAPLVAAPFISALALLFGFVVFALSLVGVHQAATPTASFTSTKRRTLLVGAVTSGLFGLGAALLMKRYFDAATFSYDGHENRGDLEAITPNDRFYSVTKNVVDPRVDSGWWRLELSGHVEHPLVLSLADLRAVPRREQETTLMCISNYLGGGLISNAVWGGVPLQDVLDLAGVRPGAVKLLLRGADGYTDTVPIVKASDGTCFVAYEMNGQPVPDIHGGPVRLLIPGLFGEKSVKWVSGIEVVDHDVTGFYEQQGWGPSFVIPTRSQFTSDPGVTPVSVPATLKGWAFGGDRGIARVEVSADGGGTWTDAVLDRPGSRISWTLWSFHWQPPAPGAYQLVVRATDGTGQLQSGEYRDTAPQGATGYHGISVRVSA